MKAGNVKCRARSLECVRGCCYYVIESLESLIRMWQEAEGGLQAQLEGMESCPQPLHGPGMDLSPGIPDETEILDSYMDGSFVRVQKTQLSHIQTPEHRNWEIVSIVLSYYILE